MKIMKIFLLPLILLNLAACQTSHLIVQKDFNYAEKITFSVSKIVETRRFSEGQHTSFRSAPGHKFVFLYLTVKNHSQEDRKIDFNNFELLDENTNKSYGVRFVYYDLFLTFRSKFTGTLGANKEFRRKVIFSFPKDASPDKLIVNGESIRLEREHTSAS